MALPTPSARLPHPDRIAIWPTESGYGIDVTWSGPDGFKDAERLTEELRRLGLQTRLLQELGRQWTARVGPIKRGDATSRRALRPLTPPPAFSGAQASACEASSNSR